MALERLQALALFWVPQDDPLVPPAAREKLAVKTPGDRHDPTAVALERLQALALFWVPQNDLVVSPAAREKLAVKTPGDGEDRTAAIFSNVREHICNGRLRLSP